MVSEREFLNYMAVTHMLIFFLMLPHLQMREKMNGLM
jgi:hypothetical protein